jgi:hypothetical protein
MDRRRLGERIFAILVFPAIDSSAVGERLLPVATCAEGITRMASSVYSRTMQKAAELAGGHKTLARHLRVPIAELQKWIAGKDTPPTATFLKAVDLVLDETPSAPSASEPADPPAPRDCASIGGNDSLML